MALTEKRKGEIALLVIINKLSKVGVKISRDARRNLGNQAKELGVNLEELQDFQVYTTMEILKKVFPRNNFKKFDENKLSDKRRGEIALFIIKEDSFKNGATISKDFTRELKNVAAEIGIEAKELNEFTQEILGEMIEKIF